MLIDTPPKIKLPKIGLPEMDFERIAEVRNMENGFLTGSAGCGKTKLIQQLLLENPEWGALTATTGIAAMNLSDNTLTINAAMNCRYLSDFRAAEADGSLLMNLKDIRRDGAERIVIDEVSMMPLELFDILYRTCKKAGLGLILTGDFLQLPPIPEYKGGPFPGWAFQSENWKKFTDNGKHIIRLMKNHRAKTDPVFCDFLALVRADRGLEAGKMLHDAGINWQSHRENWVDENFPGMTLIWSKDYAREVNAAAGDAVPGRAQIYRKESFGPQTIDWKKYPEEASLKVNHRVRVLRNRRGNGAGIFATYLYVNGTTGKVRALRPDSVEVLTDKGKIINVDRHKEDNKRWVLVQKYNGDGYVKVPRPATASVSYMPLELSYCSTVHKAQGLSLPCVQISTDCLINEYGYAGPCLLYVALSRVHRGQDVYLTGAASLASACRTDPALKPWI